jgi:hypothetical protein
MLRRHLRGGRVRRQGVPAQLRPGRGDLAVSIMPPGEGIVVELVEETLLAAAPAASATGRSVTGRSSIAAAPRAACTSRSATRMAAL